MRLRDRSFAELSSTEAYAVWRLRQQVFVVEQTSPYPDLDGRDLDASTRHLTLEEGPEIVACLRLVEDGQECRIGRVVVARPHRGKGLAGRLMDAALERVGDRLCRLDAQTPLAEWYSRRGFSVDGPEFVEDGIPHLPMVRRSGG